MDRSWVANHMPTKGATTYPYVSKLLSIVGGMGLEPSVGLGVWLWLGLILVLDEDLGLGILLWLWPCRVEAMAVTVAVVWAKART